MKIAEFSHPTFFEAP